VALCGSRGTFVMKTNTNRVPVITPEGKRLLGKPMRRCNLVLKCIVKK
jgi:hypothetical protein